MYQKRKIRSEKKNKNQESLPKVAINWFPGHMAKTEKKLKEDLKIGTATIEDRISSICYKFNFYLQNLKKIKKSFYESNNLTIPNEE